LPIADGAGNLYGTTSEGGLGWGTVYKITAAGAESVLYTFNALANGRSPMAGLFLDSSGNLIGTTSLGGLDVCSNRHMGCGVVFRLTP
jgi:uncharacterized repeat protein (TIGR03803 family)